MAESLYPGVITQETLRTIQQRIDQNIGLLAGSRAAR
jgi:serine/threonine-protein kinase HipA